MNAVVRRDAMEVRIISVPPGEAPEDIRRAWVGLTLPLAPGEVGPRPLPAFGVVSGPRTRVGQLWRVVTGRAPKSMQYVIRIDDALAALERASPEAAAWWRANTPDLVGSRRLFGFAAEVCEEIA